VERAGGMLKPMSVSTTQVETADTMLVSTKRRTTMTIWVAAAGVCREEFVLAVDADAEFAAAADDDDGGGAAVEAGGSDRMGPIQRMVAFDS